MTVTVSMWYSCKYSSSIYRKGWHFCDCKYNENYFIIYRVVMILKLTVGKYTFQK